MVQRLWEKIQSNLFYVPLMFGISGAILAELALELDSQVDDLPARLTATVDSARAVLSVIASATLTFAAIAFSVSLLLISAASSQFSPRVVHGLFRDPFNKRVMGIVVGTFIYCLVVMRAVRGPLEDAGSAVIPSVSVLIAVALGMVTILAIVAFINHSAHTMEVSNMLHRVTEEALEHVRRNAPDKESGEHLSSNPDGPGHPVRFDRQGWVQVIDYEALLAAVAPGSTIHLETTAGRYAMKGAPICRVWPDPEDGDALARAVRACITVDRSRTMQQDSSFGVRQLADVALKALSPGINDPTTAQDALFHMSSVVREMLVGPTRARRHAGDDGKVLIAAENMTPDEIVGLAFDEVRLASVGQPTVVIYLLEIIRLLLESLGHDADPAATDALRRQAELTREMAEFGEIPESDRQMMRDANTKRFT